MKSAVIIFPGSNCDRDMDVALKKFGFKNQMVWHNDHEIPKSDLIVLPGGFSYGDYLRTGAIAAQSNISSKLKDFAKRYDGNVNFSIRIASTDYQQINDVSWYQILSEKDYQRFN